MVDNYLFLLKLLPTLKEQLKHAKIHSIFTQERRKFVFECRKNLEDFFIEISLVPNFFFITIRTEFNRSGKNTLSFFEEHLPIEILDVKIAFNDRVIKFISPMKSVILAFRGGSSNIFLLEENKIIASVLNESAEIIVKNEEEFSAIDFIDTFPFDNFSQEKLLTDTEIKKKFPFANKQMLAHYHVSALTFHDFLSRFIWEELLVSENSQTFEIEILPRFIASRINAKEFGNDFDAVNFYIRKKFSFNSLQQNRRQVLNYFEKELSYLSDKMEKLKARINKGSNADEYSAIANLLLVNMHKIKSGDESVLVEDTFDKNNLVKIKLKKDLSPNQNVDYYFKKARSEKIELQSAKENFTSCEVRYFRLLKLKDEFERIVNSESLKLFFKEHKNLLKNENHKTVQADSRFKQYVIDGKYKVFVGKDSKNNDELTTKFAKQNDLWFHARGVSGSHVIIRVDNSKEPIPKNIIKKAAAIAAFHSKGKTSSLTPVAYTFKKYVTKKKSSPAGTVYLQREEVVLVKPEIPAGAEYISKQEDEF